MRRRVNKHRNIKTVVDDFTFASKAEARRYCQLKDMETRGEIEHLQLQVRFPLYACAVYADPDAPTQAVKVCDYIADATYWREEEPGVRTYIVEDTKGSVKTITPLFRLKAKLFRLNYGYDIRVVIMGRESK